MCAALHASLSGCDQFNLQYQHAGCHALCLSVITYYGECTVFCHSLYIKRSRTEVNMQAYVHESAITAEWIVEAALR